MHSNMKKDIHIRCRGLLPYYYAIGPNSHPAEASDSIALVQLNDVTSNAPRMILSVA